MKLNLKGFSLIEVTVTLLIIIALSLISWPIYRGRQKEAVALAEGYALLGIIKEAQIAYYNEYGNFLSAWHSYYTNNTGNNANVNTYNDPVLGINALNNQYYTVFVSCGNEDAGNIGSLDKYKYQVSMLAKRSWPGARYGAYVKLTFNLTVKNQPTTGISY